MKIGVMASGRGSNLEALLNFWEQDKLGGEIVVVFSDNKAAAALDRAEKRNIRTVSFSPKEFASKKAYEEALVTELKKSGVELLVLAGYMRIVGEDLLKAFPERIINIHPSLLPAFPGLDAQWQAAEYGVKVSGCTVHFVDGGMDTGPIISQRVVKVEDGETGESLAAKILIEEHQLLPEVVSLICAGKVQIKEGIVYVDKE